jgi:hypothetical protein
MTHEKGDDTSSSVVAFFSSSFTQNIMNDLLRDAPADIKRSLLADLLEISGEMLPDGLREAAETELKGDILSASLRSSTPSAALARVARLHGIPVDLVNEVANTLLREKGLDLETEEFGKAIAEVRDIEETIHDQGLREWKIQALARRYRRTPVQLMACYEKALVNQASLAPLTLSEFREQHSTDIEWLIPGWIPRATTLLLHADGGVGKTLFAYQLMESVLKGRPWNGYHVEKGSCLLVQCDEPGIVTAERIEIRGIGENLPLRILTNWQAENLPRLADYIQREKPDLIIIDSLTTINKACTFSENDTEYARPLLHLRDLANDYGATVIVIHHSNASGSARGTRAIHNSVSEVWSLRRGETLNERHLKVEKTRLGRPPGDYLFRFDDTDFTFTYLGEGEDNGDKDRDSPTEERVRLYLSENAGTAYAAEELSELLSISKNTARKVARELWAKGLCKRKRIPPQRFYSYFIDQENGVLSNVTSDLSDPPQNSPDHLRITCENQSPISVSASSDPSDPPDRVFGTIEKPENAGSLGSLEASSIDSGRTVRGSANVTSDPASDPQVIRPPKTADHLWLIENEWVSYCDFDTAVQVVKVGQRKTQIKIPGLGIRSVPNRLLAPLADASAR